MPRPRKNVTVEVTHSNIMLSVGHFLRGDIVEVPRKEALEIIEGDKLAGRSPRLEVLPDASK